MIDFLITVYCIGFFVFGTFLYIFAHSETATEDQRFVISLICGILWPIILLFYVLLMVYAFFKSIYDDIANYFSKNEK